MDMSKVNAAIEGEKQRAQTDRIEAALKEILETVRELKSEVATLKKPMRPSLDELVAKHEADPLKTAKRLGEQTKE